MGYKIPGADYTVSPQLQTNVAKDLGMQLGRMFASIGPAFAAQQKETKKLNQIRSDYETTIMVENQKVIDTQIAAGEKQIQDKSVFDQWSKEVIKRGKAATQAQIDIRFGDLTQEQKDEQLGIISDFNMYNNKSLEQIAGLTGDIDAWSDKDKRKNMVVVGDLRNGEFLLNSMTMDVLSGKSVTSLFGDNATADKTLNVDGNNNELHSIITVPKNGSYIKTMISKNSSFKDVINTGIQEGNIKESADGKSYIFERKINLNAYGGEDGFDFVIEPLAEINPTKILKDSNFLDKDGALKPESLVRTNSDDVESPPKTYQTTESLANNKIGISTYEFFDMQLLEDPNGTFMKTVNAEASALLENKRPEVRATNFALRYDISNVKNWNKGDYKNIQDFFINAPEADVKSFVNQGVKQKIYETFNKATGNKGESLVPLQIDEKLRKYLAENNITKADGKEYKVNEEIYTRKNYKVEPDSSKTGSDKVNVYQNILDQLNAPDANPASILSSPIQIPKGNKIGWNPEGDGQYVIYKSDGTPGDITLTLDEVKMQLQRGI
jgi:hypothetical protein